MSLEYPIIGSFGDSTPTSLDYLIAKYFDYETLLAYRLVWKQGYNLWKNSLFWEEKAWVDLRIDPSKFRMTNLLPAHRYLQLFTIMGYITDSSSQILTPQQFILRAIRLYRDDLVIGDSHDHRMMLALYVIEGRLDKIHAYEQMEVIPGGLIPGYGVIMWPPIPFIRRVVTTKILLRSIENKYFEMVKYLLSNYYITVERDRIVKAAIQSGDFEFIQFIVSYVGSFSYRKAIGLILRMGDYKLFDYFLTRQPIGFDWNNLYYLSYQTGNLKFIFDVLMKIKLTKYSPEAEMKYAMKSGNLRVIQHVMGIRPGIRIDWTEILSQSRVNNRMS